MNIRPKMKKLRWLFGGLAAVLVVAFLFWYFFLVGSGGDTFSSPSGSARAAWINRTLVTELKFAKDFFDENLPSFPIQEIWIEQVAERHQAFPIFRRFVGERMCIRLDTDAIRNLNKYDLAVRTNNEPTPNRIPTAPGWSSCSVHWKNNVVIAVPKQEGMNGYVLYDRKTKEDIAAFTLLADTIQ